MKTTLSDQNVSGIDHLHIFLAGNASRSSIVTSLFHKYMASVSKELAGDKKYNVSNDFFILHQPLGQEEPAEKKKSPAQDAAKPAGQTDGGGNIGNIAASVSAIGDITKEAKQNSGGEQPPDEEEEGAAEAIMKPNGKTGVAFGLIEGRSGGRIKIINPVSKSDDFEDINFKYYIGYKKKNSFAPISDINIEYNQWTFLCDASSQDFSFYYTTHSEAAKGDMPIYDAYRKNCRLKRSYDDASIYYRAIAPTIIEYAVVSTENFNSDEFLEDAVQIYRAR